MDPKTKSERIWLKRKKSATKRKTSKGDKK
jgi:hypothetical protein